MDEGVGSREKELADGCMHACDDTVCLGLSLQRISNYPFCDWEVWYDREAELAQDIHLHIRKARLVRLAELKRMRVLVLVLVLLRLSVLHPVRLLDNGRNQSVVCLGTPS